MSSEAAPAKKKKASDVDVLHCLNPDCHGMLAFEVTPEGFLNPDLHWMAREIGATRYFPCPTCHGRNVVDEVRDGKGVLRHAVTRFALLVGILATASAAPVKVDARLLTPISSYRTRSGSETKRAGTPDRAMPHKRPGCRPARKRPAALPAKSK